MKTQPNLEGKLVLWRILALFLFVAWMLALAPAEAQDKPFYVGFDTRLDLVAEADGAAWIRNLPVADPPLVQACATPAGLAGDPPAGQVLCCCRVYGGGQCCGYVSFCTGTYVPGCFCGP